MLKKITVYLARNATQKYIQKLLSFKSKTHVFLYALMLSMNACVRLPLSSPTGSSAVAALNQLFSFTCAK